MSKKGLKNMTIIEAIREVLSSEMVGMTSREIYDEIISKNLYIFPAANPPAVVNNIIRRHCLDLNFPTANAVKHFKIVGYRGKKTRNYCQKKSFKKLMSVMFKK